MDFVLLKKLMRLALRPQLVVRRGKVPFSPLPPYLVAKSNEPETLGFLGDALDAFRTGIFDGVGFEFGNFPSGTERVSGIDLDHVIREDGTLEPFAAEIVEKVNSYTEYSPSYTEYSPSGKGSSHTLYDDDEGYWVSKGDKGSFWS